MTILIPLVALVIGFALVYRWPALSVPIAYASYVSIAILAGMDAVFGGLRAVLEKRFDSVTFVSGFFVNAVLAALFAYTGDRLGVNQLYLAAVVALGVRIFYNLGLIRLLLLKRMVPGRSAAILSEPPPA
jgi:small basic protein